MHHRIKAVGGEQARQHGPVGQIAHDQLSSQHGIPVAMAQVVEHHNVVSRLGKSQHHVRADIAGSANDQNFGFHRVDFTESASSILLPNVGHANCAAKALARVCHAPGPSASICSAAWASEG